MNRYVIALLLICTSSLYAFSADSVYSRLKMANPSVRVVPLKVTTTVKKDCPLACTDGTQIIVTTKMLSYIHNEDELAGVIGHEMGHFTYLDEMKADVLGLEYAENAGYSYCKAAQLIKMYVADEKHPAGAIRYENTGCK